MNSVHIFKKYFVSASITLNTFGQQYRLCRRLPSTSMLSSFKQMMHHGSSSTPACTPDCPNSVLPSLSLVKTSFASEGRAFDKRFVFILFTSKDVMVLSFIFFSMKLDC